MAKEELEYLLSDMFKQADTDGSGVLSRQQFSACLRNTELGLSRKEINALMGEADSNHDGVVSYDEVRDREIKIRTLVNYSRNISYSVQAAYAHTE